MCGRSRSGLTAQDPPDELTCGYLPVFLPHHHATISRVVVKSVPSRCITCLLRGDYPCTGSLSCKSVDNRFSPQAYATHLPREVSGVVCPCRFYRFGSRRLHVSRENTRRPIGSQASSDKLGGKQEASVKSERVLRSVTNVTVSTAGDGHFL